ncbi:DUF2169 domain-containing protein [Sorangium sp. So ce1128]
MKSGSVSVLSLSSLPITWLTWRRPPNAQVLTIACRATFVLRPGEMVLGAGQEPPAQGERSYQDPSSLGLYAPSDRVPMKPHTDVVLVGHAFAPGGHPVRSLIARLAVGDVDKRVEVCGDRVFDRGGVLREGAPFSRMPLVYERAAGGPNTPNPVGVRPGARDAHGRTTLPNLQPPGFQATSPWETIPSIGLGPIACTWPSRRALLGPLHAAPPSDDWHAQIVPADLHPAYFNVAPEDQRLQRLRDDERIVLENLHPSHPELVTRLPGLRPRAFVEGLSGGRRIVAMRADTLWIETSRELCAVTWRCQIPLAQTPAVTVLVATELPGHSLTWDDVDRLRATRAGTPPPPLGAHDGASQTLIGEAASIDSDEPVLPFKPAPAGNPLRESARSGGLPFVPRTAAQAVPSPPAQDGNSPAEEEDDGEVVATALLRVTPVDNALPWDVPVAPGVPEPHAVIAPDAPSYAATRNESPWARGAPAALDPPAPIAVPAPPALVPGPPALAPGPMAEPWTKARAPATVTPAPATSPAHGVMHLVGFEPASLRRIRSDPDFARVLDALEEQPIDDDLDEPETFENAAELEDRREIFEILARGSAVFAEDIAPALTAATRDDGRLMQPVVLVDGRISLPFDELEALKATVSAAAPHAGVDLEAKGVLQLALQFLCTPGLPGAPAVAEGLRKRIGQTLEKRGLVSEGYLEAQVKRALLGNRCYQRCSVFGAPHMRGFFEASADRIPIYLNEDLSAKLPAVEQARVRMLAQVHPAVDQNEPHAAAMRAIALAIVTTPAPRR